MNEPTTIIIFGITGDLAQRKILPALYDLYINGGLPERTRIVGFSRRAFSHEEIQEQTRLSLPRHNLIGDFLTLITYVQGDFDDQESYAKLGNHLVELDGEFHHGCSNKLFYLSVPPTLYALIAEHLSQSGLSIPCGGPDGFARILVEKPFGNDLNTAVELDRLFGSLFQEEQVFRIDHYLAKQGLQSMLLERTSSKLLSSRWNNTHIQRIEINLYESATVGSRGAFYDGVGALADVGQNHMLQMLALMLMKIPEEQNAQSIQHARAQVLERLIPLSAREISESVRGQYDGYVTESGVNRASKTETFFSIRVHVDIPEFSGIPCVLTSGKALNENKIEVIVRFIDGTHHTFTVPPENSLRAYQRILIDCIKGDQTVFTSTQEVLAEWKFITPIIEHWSEVQPVLYPVGSKPEDIMKMV